MNSARTGKALRRLATGIAASALVLVTALPAFAEPMPPAVDVDALRADAAAQVAATQANIGGVGLSGPVVTFNEPFVQQIDIKVVASPNATPDNVKQTATDNAAVDQSTTAVPGQATATNGGVALTGPVIAGNIAIVQQINIQIVAGWIPSDGVTQTAGNNAAVGQDTTAQAGDASASGLGAAGVSGGATAISTDVVHQRNIQVFVGADPNATGSSEQVVGNDATVGQTSLAQSGTVDSVGGGIAISGAAKDLLFEVGTQTNTQLNW
jgi:hypothetical protein